MGNLEHWAVMSEGGSGDSPSVNLHHHVEASKSDLATASWSVLH